MACTLLEAGARVCVTRSADPGTQTQQLVNAPSPTEFQIDIRDYAGCERLVNAVCEKFGTLDVLINNAGRGMGLISQTFNTEPALFWRADPAAWRAII